MKIDDYKNLANKEELVNNASPITKPLTKINSAFILTALQMSEMLQKMQLTFTTNKDVEAQYVSSIKFLTCSENYQKFL